MSGAFPEEDLSEQAAPQRPAPSVAIGCVALYLLVVLALFFAILHRDDGVFTYTLDDPYIHLALAHNLAHGHYGINPGEDSSPSSSIIWPFLLVPFSGHPWNLYLPLVWNVLFCALAAWLIGRSVDRWSWRGRWLQQNPSTAAAWFVRFLPAVLLMLIANLAGLTFIGMEHGLQVLLAVACAWGMAEALSGRPIPTWCLCAAVAGPLVRYENFTLVAALCVTLYAQRRRRAALTVAVLSLIGPALFSVFLLSRGLPALPSSVLVKARVYTPQGGAAFRALFTVLENLYLCVKEIAWYWQLLVILVLIRLKNSTTDRLTRNVLKATLLAATLQVIVGRFGWFHRYEVYALIFTGLIAAAELLRTTRIRYGVLIAGLALLAAPYLFDALAGTPAAAANVYQQQYQMHRFLRDFYPQTVAVNDLGLVSYDRPDGLKVLDLWGLASPEASRQAHKDADWLDAITHSHGAAVAIIYPDWYPDGAPDDWDPLATMCVTGRLASIADRCVVFYSTGIGDKVALQSTVDRFARTLPPTVKMTLGADTTGTDNEKP